MWFWPRIYGNIDIVNGEIFMAHLQSVVVVVVEIKVFVVVYFKAIRLTKVTENSTLLWAI